MTSANERERKSATVRARIEPSLKEAAERILDGIGLDPTTVVTALYRQRKDAALLTYWGEGHTFASPANIRDLYASILDWLALTLDPPAPNGGPRPPPSEP